jgi:cytochrome c-type biogenesis protein CcmH
MIWLLGAALALVAASAVLVPALRRGPDAVGRSESTVAILRDQLAEVGRDRDRGVISEHEARGAEVEIKRRIIAAGRDARPPGGLAAGGRAVLVLAALVIPAGGVALYGVMGAPQIPSVPFAERAGEQAEAAELAAAVRQLRERLEADPEGGPTEGWMVLARSLGGMGRHRDAADAYARVTERPNATSATFSLYAEALIAAEDGIVTPRAEAAIDRARAMDPSNPAGAFYKAVALEQSGAQEEARALLLERLDAAEGFAPWMEAFVAQANRLGTEIGAPAVALTDYAPAMRGPTGEQVQAAAEMSEEDRVAFVRSMVEGLAARLAEDPADLDGWLRLARAYDVLGEADRAADAYRQAQAQARELPSDDPRHAVIADGLGDPFPNP